MKGSRKGKQATKGDVRVQGLEEEVKRKRPRPREGDKKEVKSQKKRQRANNDPPVMQLADAATRRLPPRTKKNAAACSHHGESVISLHRWKYSFYHKALLSLHSPSEPLLVFHSHPPTADEP